MTDKLILKKAIEKAEQNDYCSHCVFNCFPMSVVLAVSHERISVDEANLECIDIILTDHDFWKALCGEEMICTICGQVAKDEEIAESIVCDHGLETYCDQKAWQYHMTECLVYEKDRIKYLKQFL